MVKFATFLFILFVAALGYLAILNKEPVTLKLSEKYIYEVPEVALILLSSAIGAFSMLIVIAVRDAKRYFENWQSHRSEKKNLRIQEFYSRGLDAFFACRYEEATELFNRILNEDPNNVNALLRQGDISFNAGDPTLARDFYVKAKDIRPHSVEALFSLEKVFETEKNWQGALRYLDNILEIDERNPKALYRKRDIYELNKNWEALLDVQYKILKSDIKQDEKDREQKNLVGYRYELGRHYLEQGETEKAKKILKTIIRLDKDFTAAYLALAESYLREGDAEETESLLLKGFEASSNLVVLARLEDFFISTGEPGRIIDLYQKAIRNNPKDQKLQFFLAKLYYRLEMIDYAYETIMGIDTVAEDYRDLHLLLAEIYERRAQHDKAVDEYKKAFNTERHIIIPFCCSHCRYTSNDWAGRCPECKNWNTLSLDLSGICKT